MKTRDVLKRFRAISKVKLKMATISEKEVPEGQLIDLTKLSLQQLLVLRQQLDRVSSKEDIPLYSKNGPL